MKVSNPKSKKCLEIVKLLSKYSPVISKHFSDFHISDKMTTTIHLSPTIQNKLVLLLSKKVKNIFFQDVREAKYFAIMCDSPANISHTDQITLMVRYVTIKNSIAQVKESFLNFFPLSGKTAAKISQSNQDEIELNN